MSFKVLIIPENFSKDQYVLQPILERLLAECGKPRAKVLVCRDPFLSGITQALNRDLLAEIIERYAYKTDLFLLCVDRDGLPHRRAELDAAETWAAEQGRLNPAKRFLAVEAWQELEVWVLAGHDLPTDWAWADVRAEPNPKERYFTPLAEARGVSEQPGEGRRQLAVAAAARYDRLRQLCPEDLGVLETRIREWLTEAG